MLTAGLSNESGSEFLMCGTMICLAIGISGSLNHLLINLIIYKAIESSSRQSWQVTTI